MGVVINYRGKIKDMALIDSFELELLEQVKRLGGLCTTWRELASNDPNCGFRGAVVYLHPSCEPISLFVSRGGCLLPVIELEAAEYEDFCDPLWMGTKTQYAPVEVHVRMVELLRWLQDNYFADLEVVDEGDYWETGDIETLEVKRAIIERAIDTLDLSLAKLELSAEEREDEEAVADAIEAAVGRFDEQMKQRLH